MCMSVVEKDYRNVKERDFGIGYKNLYDNGDGKYHTYQMDLIMKKWYKADTKCKIAADDGKDYRSGFHIFLSEADARDYRTIGTVVRVRYRGVSSVGINKTGSCMGKSSRNVACVIADEMFLDEVVS